MKIDPEVRRVLETQVVVDGPLLSLTGQLDRSLYTKVNKVLEALGGKWNRKLKSHSFDDAIADRIERALMAGEVTTTADEGFFATPENLAREMAEFILPLNGQDPQVVLEPSAGDGALVKALIERSNHVPQKVTIIVVERNPKRRELLRALGSQVIVSDIDDFMDFGKHGGTKKLPTDICANPPFCKVGKGDHIDHFMKMAEMKIADGRLACVMPSSLQFREDRRYREVRALVSAEKGSIEGLPALTFKASGTSVNTCLVKIHW